MDGILIEGETQLSGTGGIGGLRGSDIVLSGPTQREAGDDQKIEISNKQLHFPDVL